MQIYFAPNKNKKCLRKNRLDHSWNLNETNSIFYFDNFQYYLLTLGISKDYRTSCGLCNRPEGDACIRRQTHGTGGLYPVRPDLSAAGWWSTGHAYWFA